MTQFDRRRCSALMCLTAVLGLVSSLGHAQEVPVIEHELENGMKVLMVPRPGDPNIAAGWIARVGSVYERPGITGVAHLFEHMMFKGTRTLGTENITEDLAIIEQLDAIKTELAVEEAQLLVAHRLGQIDDPGDPDARSPRHRELLAQFDDLLARQQEIVVKEDFSRIYTEQGASGMNAGTSYDFTVYFVNVPANKLELWFWMESDRLLNPVFREFYSERNVVHEERRLRTDSTPTGKFQEQFDAMFWGSSPYSWPVVGWPSDLEGMTREEALAFFDVYYAPNNVAAALVGDFDPEYAATLAERYFGRIPSGERPPLEPRTREMPQLAEKRMVAYADTNPQVTIRYHSVPDGHVDEPALVVLGQLLNGRTGRLYRALVEDQEVATNASGGAVWIQVRRDVPDPGHGPTGTHTGGGRAGDRRRARAAQDGARRRAGAPESEESERGEHVSRSGGKLPTHDPTALSRKQPGLGDDQHRPRPVRGGDRRRHPAGGQRVLHRRESGGGGLLPSRRR